MKANEIVIKPVVSEKSVQDAGTGKYTFLVTKDANKDEIKGAIKQLFNVEPIKVFTNIFKGEKVRMTKFGRKKSKFSFKKARVVLKAGQKINVFEEFMQKS